MTGRRLEDEAAERLAELGPRTHANRAVLERVVVDVRIGDRRETAVVGLRDDGTLSVVSTEDGPHAEATRRAFELLAGEPVTGVELRGASERAPSEARRHGDGGPARAARTVTVRPAADVRADSRVAADARAVVADGRTTDGRAPSVDGWSGREAGRPLARAAQDLVLAIARVGAREAGGAPSVEDALKRLLAAAPSPLPLGLARFVGRLRGSFASGDAALLARLLESLCRFADAAELAEPSASGAGAGPRREHASGPPAASSARPPSALDYTALLGATPSTSLDDVAAGQRVFERTWVEVAREWVAGVERAGIERRYLVDVGTGELVCEERLRATSVTSIGPCPRQLEVGLAELDPGPRPRRARVLQYAVSLTIPRESWTRLRDLAARDFGEIAAVYREDVERFPGVAEPVVLLAPDRCDASDGFALLDASGRALSVARADDPGGFAFTSELLGKSSIAWVVGRLTDADGFLYVRPLSIAVLREGRSYVVRVT